MSNLCHLIHLVLVIYYLIMMIDFINSKICWVSKINKFFLVWVVLEPPNNNNNTNNNIFKFKNSNSSNNINNNNISINSSNSNSKEFFCHKIKLKGVLSKKIVFHLIFYK